MRFFRNIFSKWHLYLSWAILGAILWGWIFTLLTSARPSRKLTVFEHSFESRAEAMSMELEKEKPENIKMISVHSFDYALFGQTGFTEADVFIIRESEIATYISDFISLETMATDHPEWHFYLQDGVPYGIQVYDAAARSGAAMSYLTYDGKELTGLDPEDYYLFIGKNSVHIGGEGQDDLAFALTEHILRME